MRNEWNIAAPITFAILALGADGFTQTFFGVLACVALVICSSSGWRR